MSMGFSRQEYWSGLSFSSSEDLPNPGIEPGSSELQADCLLSELQGSPQETDTSKEATGWPAILPHFKCFSLYHVSCTSSQNPALGLGAPTHEHQEAGKLGPCLGGVCVCVCVHAQALLQSCLSL